MLSLTFTFYIYNKQNLPILPSKYFFSITTSFFFISIIIALMQYLIFHEDNIANNPQTGLSVAINVY